MFVSFAMIDSCEWQNKFITRSFNCSYVSRLCKKKMNVLSYKHIYCIEIDFFRNETDYMSYKATLIK
jgi:hypothetical protein